MDEFEKEDEFADTDDFDSTDDIEERKCRFWLIYSLILGTIVIADLIAMWHFWN